MTSLYGIVDTARDECLYDLVVRSEEYACLYAGKLEPALERASPHIVRLADDSLLLEAWRRDGWGRSWGIQCTSTASLAEMRRHFRHFLRVQVPDGRVMLFRFYDPRVWRIYLPTCGPADLSRWFAAVEEYRVEASDGRNCLHFGIRSGSLEISDLPVEATGWAKTPRQVDRSMLSLSENQYGSLHEDAIRRWHERLMQWLRDHVEAARGFDDAALRSLIERQEKRAARYGIETQRALAKWCAMSLISAETFENGPYGPILQDSSGTPEERLDTLMDSYPVAEGIP